MDLKNKNVEKLLGMGGLLLVVLFFISSMSVESCSESANLDSYSDKTTSAFYSSSTGEAGNYPLLNEGGNGGGRMSSCLCGLGGESNCGDCLE